MPFPKATKDLAATFGIKFSNGFAIDTITWGATMFYGKDHSLSKHPIVIGQSKQEIIDSVATYWGQGFTFVNNKATGLMEFKKNVISYYPDTAWRFNEYTPTTSMEGWWQGVAIKDGKGRVVILGESGLMTAQISTNGNTLIGLNSRKGVQNEQFVLNTLHWLDSSLK
jgi:hypothetical protein